jgi:hypothetical protein
MVICNTSKAGVFEACIGRGFHAGRNTVTAAVGTVTKKGTASYHPLWNGRFIGVITG